MSFKAVCLATLITLAGCASPKSVTKPPVVAPAAKAEPISPPMPSVVLGTGWSIDLQEPLLWERRLLPAKPAHKTMDIEGNWVTLKKFGAKPIVLTVMTTDVEVGQKAEEFIISSFMFQDTQPDIQTFKVIKVHLDSGEVAGIGLQGRHTSYGDIGVMELITMKGLKGYIVTCSAGIEDAELWTETCDEVISSFILTDKT